MSDLLTPAELAAMLDRAHDLRAARFFKEADWLFALLRHIAALEARTPAQQFPDLSKLRDDTPEPEVFTVVDLPDQQQDLAPEIQQLISANMDALVDQPAPATDVDALLADAEHWARLTRKLTSDVEQGCAHVLRLATALRESRAREVAEPYRHALEQRLVCSNLPLLTGDADADLMRFVFHEQEIALSPEAGVIAELKEQRDTALSWTATYTNMDVYRRCLAAAIARAEKAEAEQQTAYAAGERVGYHNACNEKNLALQKANNDIAAARAELGALGPVENLNTRYGVIRIRRVLEGGAQ